MNIFVTGGSGDLGGAVVRRFARERGKHNVVFTYFHGEEAARRASAETGARAVRLDVRDYESTFELAHKNPSDVLVNCHGISEIKMFQDITPDRFSEMLAVNLTGVYNTCHAFLPYMLRRHSGSIVNVSSQWGVSGASCEVHYSASKAGVIGLSKALALEVGISGVNVSCVTPWIIDGTRMNTDILSAEEIEELRKSAKDGRFVTREEVAEEIYDLSFLT